MNGVDDIKILDATCGAKQMWYQKNHPFVTYMDKRKGKVFYQYPNSNKKYKLKFNPDIQCEWEDMPFPDEYFDMVIFDPPHILQKKESGCLAMKYSVLNPKTWKVDLKVGINQCFRVLKKNGTFILKWDECCMDLSDIIKLFPYPPLFGTRTGKNNKNIWLLFLKHNCNGRLEEYIDNNGGVK